MGKLTCTMLKLAKNEFLIETSSQ